MKNNCFQIKNITSKEKLTSLVKELKAKGNKIVFTTGCFDIIHKGHVTYLQKAKKLGHILIVGINSDNSIRQTKGPLRPINPLEDRITVITALESVDYVISYPELYATNLIEIIKPNFFAKGSDWQIVNIVEAPYVNKYGGQIKLISIIKNYSTTTLIQKIINIHNHISTHRIHK